MIPRTQVSNAQASNAQISNGGDRTGQSMPPTRAPAQPPSDPPGAKSRRGRRWWRPRLRVRTIILLLVLGWLTFLVVTPILAWKDVTKVGWEPTGDRPPEQDGTTYLMVGSDSRAGLSPEERKELSTGNATSNLADTIMLLHTGSGPNLLMSFNRDTVLEIPACNTTAKINSAYACGGPPALVGAIENRTGIRIDDYVEIGLGGVPRVVDAVGGIEICPKTSMDDDLAGLQIKKGCQTVDGATALAYSRSRHASPLSDLARVQQQREVVAAVGDKVLSPWTVINPVRWWKLNHAVPDFFAFGEGTSPMRAGLWAMAMAGDNKTCSAPLTDGSATTLDAVRADRLFAKIAADDTDSIEKNLCTATGLAKS